MPDRDAEQFNVVADFSPERNPNGPWSYGSAVRPGELVRFSERQSDAIVQRWYPRPDVDFPDARRNVSGKSFFRDGALLPVDALILRPGHRLEHMRTYSVVRFTAPGPGAYRFRGRFEAVAISYGGTTQLIVHGEQKLAENTFINAHGQIWEFDQRQDLRAGEWVDFLVSNSPQGDNSNDDTGLALTVAWQTPRSPLWWGGLVGATLAGLVAWRMRRSSKRNDTGSSRIGTGV